MRGKLPAPHASLTKFITVVLVLIFLALLVSLIGPGAVSTFTTEAQWLVGP